MSAKSVPSRIQRAPFFHFLLITLCLFALFTSTLLSHGEAFCAQVTLAWDPVADSSLQGYKVYYGTASRNYPTSIDVRNVTTYQVTGLGGGTTYYFAVKSHNSSGESAFSNEVTYTTPQSCTYSLSSKGASYGSSGGAGNVTVNAPGGCTWSSSTPPSWLNLTSGASGTGNGSVVYSVAPNNNTSSRTVDLTIAGQVFTVMQNGLQTFTVRASAASGGKISPAGTVQVTSGSNQTFSISRYPGYIIADVKVDGVSVGKVNSYTFSNLTASHTIAASFAH
jgi:Fibronectin type III domain